MMDAGISAKPAHVNRSKPIAAREALASIWRCFANIGAAAMYLLRPRHVRSLEGNAFEPAAGPVAVKAGAAALPAVNVNAGPEVNAVTDTSPGQQEIERRRNLVRIFFNDFWSGVSNKPTAFVERLDEAEDYLNERLAANGECWRVDAKTRVMLGLPPRSKVSANVDGHISGQMKSP